MSSTSPIPVIIGSGLAGLVTALELGHPCLLITAGPFAADCSSDLAQGGLAAAVGPDDDIELHIQDTIAAGAGLCEPEAVRHIISRGPRVVEYLQGLGVPFDRAHGVLTLGLEGAHHRRRIVHVDGDSTGHAITKAAAEAVRDSPWVTVVEKTRACQLLLNSGGAVEGIVVDGATTGVIPTEYVVLATGGLGGLFAHTTNPRGSWGSGLALGLRAGALARDLEMVQFHPTALVAGTDPMPLVSEAVRGEGARLVDERGRHLLSSDLAPRDVVSRAVADRIDHGGRVYLDTQSLQGGHFGRRFPTVAARCLDVGLDPSVDPLPVRPAAHYHMGGLVVDTNGRTTVPGLWAVGEVASTGLHGANRLASNSLLEAVVTAQAAADDLRVRAEKTPQDASSSVLSAGWGLHLRENRLPDSFRRARAAPAKELRQLMEQHCGVLRDEQGLRTVLAALRPEAQHDDTHLVALMIAWSALLRNESRGGHSRTDHPGGKTPTHTILTVPEALAQIDSSAAQNRSA